VVAARFPAVGIWRPGRLLRATMSVLVDEACAIMALHKPRGNRGPEIARPPVGAVAISSTIASRCEATRAARRCSFYACRER
jgi:hypothetical protein